MSVRIKEGMIPYTWWIGIEVTDNHVINLLLREENNLIHVNEDNEVYVDLQLDDGILPDADFPVGITTGKILQSDWWQDSWIILNWKTTSGDYTRLIYANDGKLYYDPWTWVWNEIWGWGWSINVATATALWVIKLWSNTVQTEAPQTPTSVQWRTYAVQLNSDNQASVNVPWEEYSSLAEVQWGTDESLVTTGEKYRWNHKQDQLTAGNNITISNWVISANITNVYTYKGSVATQSDLPSSWQTVGDVWYALDTGISYAWNWTSWMSMWSFVDLSNYFNKTTDDSDDITEWSTHLFTTTAEKTYWNWKQDELTAGSGITINNNVISADEYTAGNGINIDQNNEIENTLPFDPDNAWVTGQILQKTSAGYEWKNFPNVVNSVNGQSWAVNVDEFEPSNTWTVGQVLKKTANGYGWYPESWWGWGWGDYSAGHWINIDANDEISNTLPFEPSNAWTVGQVIKKTATGYQWANESWWWGSYTAGDWISIDSNNVIDNTWVLSVNNQTWAVTVNEVPSWGNEGQVLQKTSSGYAWMNAITDANVKQWTINSNSVSGTTLKEIHDWVIADANNWAIIWDSYTNDVFLYHHTTTGSGQTNLIFYGVKRTSQKYTGVNWDYTEAWQLKMAITYNGSSYSCVTSRNTDDATVTNYLSVEWSGYTTPFIPVSDYQPTTKKYVDDRAVPTSGTTGDVLTKTANGYGWSAPTWWFSPTSAGTTWQVLKKTGANTYDWWDELWLTILSYGSSTWNDFITAYNANRVVFCKASSNSNPWTWTQWRMAFMAYVNNPTTPTSVEFQYYRSRSSTTYADQTDEVYVYTLSSNGTWSVTTRKASSQIVAGTGLDYTYDWTTRSLTLKSNTTATTATLTVAGWSSSTQTVNVTGVTATNQVIVAPDPTYMDDYAEKGIYCSGQGSGTLTFTCGTTPTASITVNVLIMNL